MSLGTEFELDEPVCPTCGDEFSSVHGVKTHHSIEHEEKLPNLVCCSCDSEFYNSNPRELCDNCIDNLYECPTCGEEFPSDNGMKTHHYFVHNESIAEYRNQKREEERDRERSEPCPNCGRNLINMGQHWKSSNCRYPELSDYQKDLLRGILMSDASVQFDENNRFVFKMTTETFLEWFCNELDVLCPNKYPILHLNSEESKQNAIDYFGGDAVSEESEYKEKYRVLTRSHPFMNEFDDWYVPEKRYPLDDLELTPTVAKMWYCGDGSLDRSKGRAEIACTNEADRIDEVADLIREQGFDVNTTSNGVIHVPSRETPRFLEWMGEAPPDFGYKWL